MNRANQPAEFHFSDNELDALEGVLGAGTIIEQKQDSGCDLDGEEKERHPAKVVPDRLAVDWDFLFLGHGRERADRETLVKPVFEFEYLHPPNDSFSICHLTFFIDHFFGNQFPWSGACPARRADKS